MPRDPKKNKKKQGKKQHLFVFTINNPLEENDDELFSLVLAERKLTYIGFEHEVGENGTPHIQGFFRTRIRVFKIFVAGPAVPAGIPFRGPLILPGTAGLRAYFLHVKFTC